MLAIRAGRIAWSLLAGVSLLVTILSVLLLARQDHPAFTPRLLCALTGALTVTCLWHAVRPRPASDSLGSAAFAPPTAEWTSADERDGCKEAGAVYLGRYANQNVILPRAESLRHGLILGPTGSGKSYGFFLPNLARQDIGSVVCTDPKSELWRHTAGLHREAYRFAPGEPDASRAFNWIPLCRDPRLAERLARAIVESGQTERTEQVWLDLEAGFLAALFSHAATLAVPTPLTAYRLLTRLPAKSLLAAFDASTSEVAREQANLLRQTTERVKGSVLPVVAARLQFLRDPAVARFTSSTLAAPDFTTLRRRPQALYWCQSEQDATRLRPLSAAFFTVLIEQLLSPAEGEGGGGVPITLFLDEFAAIGGIPDFATLIAVARGRGLSFWLGVQSLAQLELRYGGPAARAIVTNCQTKVVLPGLDADSAEWASRTLGQGTRLTDRESFHGTFGALLPRSVTVGDTEHARPLLTADEVRRLGDRECLAVVANRRPLRLLRTPFVTEPHPGRASPLPRALSEAVEFETVPADEPPPLPPDGSHP